MTKLIFLGGAAALALAGAVLAQPPAGSRPDRPDRDADVTRQQVIDRSNQMFQRLDANHDGRFTPEEAQAMGAQRRAERMGRMFDHLDANHDGNVSRDEFAQAHADRGPGDRGGRGGMRGHRRMGPPPGGPDGGPGMGPPPPGGPGGHGPMGGMRGQRLFGTQGFATAEQFRARAVERFDRADADHDGTLTAAERHAARGQMRDRMRQRRGDGPRPESD